MGVLEEGAKAAGSVVTALGTQPLMLSMVVTNLLLLGLLYYVQASINKQRQETVGLIVHQQTDTEKLLANCVSADVTRMMLDNVQRVTDTMLSAEQKEIARMQEAINNERQKSWELRQREQKELDELKRQQPPQDAPPRMQRMSGHTVLPLPPLPSIPYLPISGDQPN